VIRSVESASRGMRRTAAVVLVLAMAAAIAGCSSSKAKSGSPATKTSTSSSTSGATASSADVAAITSAYTRFFNPKTSLAESMSLLQDGAAFKAALEQQATTAQAKTASATVSKVNLQSPNTAVVTFTILISGSPVLKDTPGYAVREGGTWKVAGQTFCGLLVLNGGAPPACDTAAATSLPK
jgi:hypothetical protein